MNELVILLEYSFILQTASWVGRVGKGSWGWEIEVGKFQILSTSIARNGFWTNEFLLKKLKWWWKEFVGANGGEKLA